MKPKSLYRVPIGSQLVLDGYCWVVLGKDQDGYAVKGSDGSVSKLSFARITQAIANRDCDVITPVGHEKPKELLAFTGGFEHREQLSQDEQYNVRARLTLVLALERIEENGERQTERYLNRPDVVSVVCEVAEQICGGSIRFRPRAGGRTEGIFLIPKGRSLLKYKSLLQKFDRNPVVLMHRDNLKGQQTEAGRRKLDPIQEAFCDYFITHWLKVTKPKIGPLLALTKGNFYISDNSIARGFKFPSVTTIRTRSKRVSKMAKIIGHMGDKEAANLNGAGSTDARAYLYGEKGETDQVYLSIFTDKTGKMLARQLDPKLAGTALEENEIIRIWLFLLIDVARAC